MIHVDAILTMAVMAAAMAFFISGRVRIDLIALCVLAALLLLGLIDRGQALYGFANSATGTVAAMFVLSAGLVRTGLVQWLAGHIDRLAGRSEWRLILVLCAVIAALSAFIVNTATVAIFIPVAVVLAGARGISSSRVLMPLSFASQFGGVCTLIGTSTNILVNSIAQSAGIRGFGLFEFAPLGLVMVAVGVLYLIFMSRWMLPRRDGEVQHVDKYRLADYLAEMKIREKSPLIGTSWDESEVSKEPGVNLIKLVSGAHEGRLPAKTTLGAGDILLLGGHMDKLIGLGDKYALELQADEALSDEKLGSDEVKLVEALVPPRSRLVGHTLRSFDFFRRYGSIVLALQRRGRILRTRLADISLVGGDTLLIRGDRNGVTRLMKSRDLIVTNELTELYMRKDRAVSALIILIGVVVLAALNVVPILVAALVGAVAMILTRCLNLEEAYRAIDWQVVFLLGGIIPLGLALERSGAAGWMAGGILGPLQEHGPRVVLAALYLVTAVLTETMSNNAAAVILAPIALSLAAAMGVSARPFLVAITFAASTSFATPIGYQTNTMIYAPGGYRFVDYTRIGGPLNLIFWALAVLLIPALFPF